ncbi:hypothetical protein ACIGHG_06020 [Bacillus sp. NPDC077411]|uniref:Uncharacterized protein n=1 Tax=Bacillus bruguierae TaxID=3127667 RepID=A0ABU8FJF8_9BACI
MGKIKKMISIVGIIGMMVLGFLFISPLQNASAADMGRFTTQWGTKTIGTVWASGDKTIWINGVNRYHKDGTGPIKPANVGAIQVRLCTAGTNSCTSWKSFTETYSWPYYNGNARFTGMRGAYYNVQITDAWENYYFTYTWSI